MQANLDEMQNYSNEPEGTQNKWHTSENCDYALSWVVRQLTSLEAHSDSLRHVLRHLLLSWDSAVTELLNHLT